MPAELALGRGAAQRDAKVLTLVGTGHFFSHFYGIVLPPLFPLLQAELAVSYAALGLLLTLPNLATMVLQTPVGVLVDRFGARRLLVLGLVLMGGGVAAAGLVPGYAALLGVMLLVGIGNSVFHPADYAILSARISPARLGRAFSLHTFAGHVGWSVAPAIVVLLTGLWSWQAALVVTGVVGLAVALTILLGGRELDGGPVQDRAATRRDPAPGASGTRRSRPGLALLLSAPMLLFFLYNAMAAFASGGLHGFMVSALVDLHDAELATANAGLTAFLIAGALGVLLGGLFADRARRHDLVIAAGFSVAATVLVLVGLVPLPILAVVAAMTVVGLARGSIQPSRDLLVRSAAPEGTVGTVFGFVTTGLNVGGALAPVFFGWLIDQGLAAWVFILAAAALLLALVAALLGRRATERLKS